MMTLFCARNGSHVAAGRTRTEQTRLLHLLRASAGCRLRIDARRLSESQQSRTESGSSQRSSGAGQNSSSNSSKQEPQLPKKLFLGMFSQEMKPWIILALSAYATLEAAGWYAYYRAVPKRIHEELLGFVASSQQVKSVLGDGVRRDGRMKFDKFATDQVHYSFRIRGSAGTGRVTIHVDRLNNEGRWLPRLITLQIEQSTAAPKKAGTTIVLDTRSYLTWLQSAGGAKAPGGWTETFARYNPAMAVARKIESSRAEKRVLQQKQDKQSDGGKQQEGKEKTGALVAAVAAAAVVAAPSDEHSDGKQSKASKAPKSTAPQTAQPQQHPLQQKQHYSPSADASKAGSKATAAAEPDSELAVMRQRVAELEAKLAAANSGQSQSVSPKSATAPATQSSQSPSQRQLANSNALVGHTPAPASASASDDFDEDEDEDEDDEDDDADYAPPAQPPLWQIPPESSTSKSRFSKSSSVAASAPLQSQQLQQSKQSESAAPTAPIFDILEDDVKFYQGDLYKCRLGNWFCSCGTGCAYLYVPHEDKPKSRVAKALEERARKRAELAAASDAAAKSNPPAASAS